MRELSVFIDESGDFGDVKERPAYYLVTFVFHDQDNDIERQVVKLEESAAAVTENEKMNSGSAQKASTDNIWLELNATRKEFSLKPISTGQEVVIVIGENMNEARIREYLGTE